MFSLYLDEDDAGSLDISEGQKENEGPPQLSDDEVAQLDHESHWRNWIG